jgi:hypothetical protein
MQERGQEPGDGFWAGYKCSDGIRQQRGDAAAKAELALAQEAVKHSLDDDDDVVDESMSPIDTQEDSGPVVKKKGGRLQKKLKELEKQQAELQAKVEQMNAKKKASGSSKLSPKKRKQPEGLQHCHMHRSAKNKQATHEKGIP